MKTIHSEIGEQNHRMLYHLETAIQRLRGMGYGDNQAGRLAMIMVFRLEGMAGQEAIDAARKIFPPENDKAENKAY